MLCSVGGHLPGRLPRLSVGRSAGMRVGAAKREGRLVRYALIVCCKRRTCVARRRRRRRQQKERASTRRQIAQKGHFDYVRERADEKRQVSRPSKLRSNGLPTRPT